jgi:hypothetical protein
MSETSSKSVKEAVARICASESAQVQPSAEDVDQLAKWNKQLGVSQSAKLITLNCTYDEASN